MREWFKKILILLIMVAVIASVIVWIQRNTLEEEFKQVELCMSLDSIKEMILKEGIEEDKFLSDLYSNGMISIALHEDSIEKLISQGKVSPVDPVILATFFNLNSIGDRDTNDLNGSLFFLVKDFDLLNRIKLFFLQYLGENNVKDYSLNENGHILQLIGESEEIKQAGIGFSLIDANKINSLGFNIILRPKNTFKVSENIINQKLWNIQQIKNLSIIIFDEEEVLGYPDRNQLFKTSAFIRENRIPYGIIEFASQKGIHVIGFQNSELAVRVHSITKEEMEKINFNTAIERWIRAAKERNIRLFYINPFLNIRDGSLIQYNLDYIDTIKNELIQNHFQIKKSSLFPSFQIPLGLILIIALGIVSAGLWLIKEIFPAVSKYEMGIFFLISAFLFGIYLISGKIFLMKILSLTCAIIFPVLAIISSKDYFLNVNKKYDTKEHLEDNEIISYPVILKKSLFLTTRIAFISLLGGLFVGALLTHYQFILAIQLFSGIKIAFILPLFIIAFYFWNQKDSIFINLSHFLKKPILFEHVFLILVFLLFGIVYITRSGNFSFLPVPAIEEKMRLFLEKALVARPRSKEFLIGYPLLSLAMLMNFLHIHTLKIPLLIMGTVAPITVLNTFCHAHTSLSFSLLRTLNGYWLGIIFSLALISVVYFLYLKYERWKNDKQNI